MLTTRLSRGVTTLTNSAQTICFTNANFKMYAGMYNFVSKSRFNIENERSTLYKLDQVNFDDVYGIVMTNEKTVIKENNFACKTINIENYEVISLDDMPLQSKVNVLVGSKNEKKKSNKIENLLLQVFQLNDHQLESKVLNYAIDYPVLMNIFFENKLKSNSSHDMHYLYDIVNIHYSSYQIKHGCIVPNELKKFIKNNPDFFRQQINALDNMRCSITDERR